MKLDWIDPDRGPTPEQLGAYADGELSDADRDAVDAWLHRHPALAAEVDALQRVTQLWRDTPPPQPGPGAWSTVRNKIEARLNGPSKPAVPPPTSPRFGLVFAAAAVLALVLLGKANGPVPAAEEPFPVISADDVAILSITGNDCACLVAARPPVSRIDDHELAMQDDVVVLNWDGLQTDPRFEDGAPMMFTPPAGWQREP